MHVNIKDRLKNDLKDAMKTNNTFLRDTIRLINASIKQIEVDKRIELNDDDIINVLLNAKKQRLDSIKAYEIAKRNDLAEKENKELEIILKYLPKQLNDYELKIKIKEIINNVNAVSIKDLGKVMNESKKLSKVADGSKIASIAKSMLL